MCRAAGVTATPLGTGVCVAWNAPDWNGGLPITRYRVNATSSASGCSTADTTSCVVSDLSAGKTHSFVVIGSNDAGDSIASVGNPSIRVR